jgi:hypothetical protein
MVGPRRLYFEYRRTSDQDRGLVQFWSGLEKGPSGLDQGDPPSKSPRDSIWTDRRSTPGKGG